MEGARPGTIDPAQVQEIREALPLLIPAAIVCALLARLLFRARSSPLSPASAEPREPPLWGGLETLAVFAMWFLVPVFLVAAAAAAGLHSRWDPDLFRLVLGGMGQLAVGGLSLYLVLVRLGQPPETLGLAKVPLRHLGGVILLHVLLFLPLGAVNAIWVLFLQDGLGVPIEQQDLLKLFKEKVLARDMRYIAALAFGAVVVAPVVEEIVFRGLLFGWLREKWGPGAAALISSLVFSVIHFSYLALGGIFVLALVLCAVRARTRSLYPCMLLHALFNGQSLLFSAIGMEAP
jgi:membrane protease YdiL (CAAX protease family)